MITAEVMRLLKISYCALLDIDLVLMWLIVILKQVDQVNENAGMHTDRMDCSSYQIYFTADPKYSRPVTQTTSEVGS